MNNNEKKWTAKSHSEQQEVTESYKKTQSDLLR